MRSQLLQLSGLTSYNHQDKYLGLPVFVEKRKYGSFALTKDKVWDWKNIYLSQAGKEILLKLVAQVVPTYSMSLLLCPKKLCKDIAILMSSFWWCYGKKEKRI